MEFLTKLSAWLSKALQYQLGSNSVQEYVLSFCVFVLFVIILKYIKVYAVRHLKRIAEKTKTDLDDLLIKSIENITWFFYVLVALYIAAQFVMLPLAVSKIISYFLIILLTYYAIRAGINLVDYTTSKIIKKEGDEPHRAAMIVILGKIAKASLWMIAGLLILSNLGYNVSTLVAGLGIGGIAIALSLQNILSDLFCSIAIYFDKPFQIGDFIILGEHLGTVRQIGLRSTRLKSLSGEELVISNKELTSTRIRNYKKMQKRRIAFGFGVTYDTSADKLRKIPGIIKEIFSKQEQTELNRVHFKNFGDFSLNFETVYFVTTGDYNIYMDIQQAVNLDIKEEFEKEGIEMAFPTQTLYVNKQN